MKNVRSLLFLVAAVFLISVLTSTALAGNGDNGDKLSLAAIDNDTFTLAGTDMVIALMEWDTTDIATPLHVGANKVGYKVMQFFIQNSGATADTLESITFKSFNDKDYSTSRIALYEESNPTTPLWSLSNPGAFSENTTVTASGLNFEINASDSTVFYFAFDSDSTAVDTSYNDLYVGVKITGGGVTMTNAGQAPTVLVDTLMYDTGTLGYGSGGRLVNFDTKPPELDVIEFAISDDASCVGTVNLGDSITISVADTTGAFEIGACTADLVIFGGTASTAFSDTIVFDLAPIPDDSAMSFGWRIPDSIFAGAGDIAAGFYWLHVTAQDVAGNSVEDSILLSNAIDTEKPTFDGDSVWVELYYDANEDGIAAIGDTVSINAWMTGNPIGEVSTVTTDMTAWGYGPAIALEDQSGDRKFIKLLELTAGALDLAASDSGSIFYVTATDNACNSITDSNLANFAIDNEIPNAPTITYVRQFDHDTNNWINIYDSIKVTVDASSTADLGTTCEIMGDFWTSGLGGSQTQCIEDTTVAGVYTYTTMVNYGGATYAGMWTANTHTIDITLTDDAGNMETFTSPAIIYPVDTDPPSAVANLSAARGACAIDLDWDAVTGDDSVYVVFWDGGDGWSASDTATDALGHLNFLDTLGSTTSTSWTTDGTVVLTHGTTYQFVVRTIDNANNREYNFNRVSEIADCEAPIACVTNPESGGAYGTGNDLDIIAESDDLDIDGATLFVRDADMGTGTPGPWMSFGAMANPGSGGVFTMTIDSAKMAGFGCVDDSYELIVTAADEVGNAQSIAEAITACGIFDFDWFCLPLPVELISVNDTVSPQTSCGFNVVRAPGNVFEINVTNFTAGATYTVDVNVINDWVYTRVFYLEDIDAMPFTFEVDCTDWPKGTQEVWIEVTRNDGNSGMLSVEVCVPDEDAPMAYMTNPADGIWVRKSCNFGSTFTVTAEIWSDTYDPTNVTKVEFAESADGETWTVFNVVTSGFLGEYNGEWNNCAYSQGDEVWLRATFYDDFGNTFTTPAVKVWIDETMPDVSLEVLNAVTDACGNDIIGGTAELRATVNTTWEDIDEVYFIYAPLDSPDIAGFYRLIGTGQPANNTNIYTATLNTATLVDGMWYRYRVIARDITGNTMFDYDGDGNMDDYTFDVVNNGSDAIFMVDNSVPDVVFGEANVYDGGTLVNTFPTPSEQLDGAGRIYAQKGHDITVQGWPLPMDDTCCIREIYYLWDGDIIGTSSDMASMFEFTFNPFELGLISELSIENGYVSETLSINVIDCLGNSSESTDEITVYILDVDNNGLVWVTPAADACVNGTVDLSVLSINAAAVDHVNFYYRTPGGDWNFIGSSSDLVTKVSGYSYFWTTNGLADGPYELGAVSVDPSDNESEAVVTAVTVANAPSVATLTAPADLAYVGDVFQISATVTGSVDRVYWRYKSITSNTWLSAGGDDFPPYEDVFEFGADGEGWYHFAAMVENCAGVQSWSESNQVFYDKTNPDARLTEVAGQDAGYDDFSVDVTGLALVPVTGWFADDNSTLGNSGLNRIGFRLSNDTIMVDEILIDPASAGYHTAQFDISGLGIGRYTIEIFSYDNVGNYTTDHVHIYIYDYTAPTVAIAGYYGGMIYGYDWSGDAEKVLFQRWDAEGEEWIGIAFADECSNRIWAAPWYPEAGSHTLRVVATDDEGNYDDDNALTAVYNATTGSWGTTSMDLVAKNNYTSCDMNGILRVTYDAAPVVIGIYGSSCARISLSSNSDDDLYYGSYNASPISGGGTAFFMGSYPVDGVMEIATTSFTTFDANADFGTYGTVSAYGGDVTVMIPAGAVDGSLDGIIQETWIPEAGIDQDHFNVVGNDDGYGWYIGCTDCYEGVKEGGGSIAQHMESCCFNNNKFATIKLAFDAENTTPAESLAVAYWDDEHNEWMFDGIYYPTFVEGFNTTDHYVEFASDCLYGLYAVVSYRTPSHEGPIAIEWVDYGSCGYYDSYPIFKLNVWDQTINNSDIDEDTWQMWVDGKPIVVDGEEGNGYEYEYDHVTNVLYVNGAGHWWWYDEYYDYDWEVSEALACGTHTFKIGVKNNQGQYGEETFEFMVDCAPPNVVFENGYVGKNPTIEFYVTDEMSGVDKSSIHVDVVAIQTSNTNPNDPNQYEQLFFLQTFFPEQITIGEEGLVTIPTTFELEDERAIVVVIYDGHRTYDYSYADPVAYDDWDEYYEDDHGIADCVGNHQTPVVQILAIDVEAPTIWVVGYDTPGNEVYALPGICPVQIQVLDDGGGFDANDLTIFEDGEPVERVSPDEVEEGTYSFNTTTGMINYCPTPGADVEITVMDESGNVVTRIFGSGDPGTIVDATLNENPWDPASGTPLTIDFGYSGPATVKIYDFGGDLVWSSGTVTNGTVQWRGVTEDGTMVADGVYFGYIEVQTDGGMVSTVVKIAVVEK